MKDKYFVNDYLAGQQARSKNDRTQFIGIAIMVIAFITVIGLKLNHLL
jgi:hypothetical protein